MFGPSLVESTARLAIGVPLLQIRAVGAGIAGVALLGVGAYSVVRPPVIRPTAERLSDDDLEALGRRRGRVFGLLSIAVGVALLVAAVQLL